MASERRTARQERALLAELRRVAPHELPRPEVEVPATPCTDEEFAELPILDLDVAMGTLRGTLRFSPEHGPWFEPELPLEDSA